MRAARTQAGRSGTPASSAAPHSPRPEPAHEVGRVARALPELRDVLVLTKPRIVGLLVATGLGSAVAATRGWPGWGPVLAVAVGGGLAAAGGGAINAALEGDLDARMARTRARPVPAGRISPRVALAIGLGLEAVAFWAVSILSNLLAAALALGGALWYAAVYTLWLKRRTSWNIVIGGAAGSFPPLVGWAAATGRLEATAWALAAVVFFWTPSHFWALATVLREDYRRAGVPMLPVVAEPRTVAARMVRYALLTLGASLAPLAWGGLGGVHAVVALVSGLWFVRECFIHRSRLSRATAGRVFWASGPYLLLVFVAVALDRALS